MNPSGSASIRRGRIPLASPALLGLLAAFLLMLAHPGTVAAHPLGNFTVNQYSRIELMEGSLRLVYVLDLAEIPAFQEIDRIDTDRDETVSDAERAAYLPAKLAEITPALHLTVGGETLPLRAVEHDLMFTDGQAGLKTMRLRAVFAADAAPVAAAAAALTYRNDYATDRLGWREVVVTHGVGVRLDTSDAPTTDTSNELRAYPEDLLSSPLDQTHAAFAYTLVPGAPPAPGFGAESPATEGARPDGGTSGSRFAALLDERDLTAFGVLVALAAAMGWGALHALSPGHGKTVVGAYLVGSRGTPRHAVFLGLTVTITHTAGVFALGLVTLFASRYIVPDQLYPWMTLVSGLLVVAMGLTVLRQRLLGRPAFGHHHHHHADLHQHDHAPAPDHHHPHGHAHDHHHHHDHDHGFVHSHGGHTHSHLPPGADGSRTTWRGLLALGVSGGLLPCPSALLVLLGAIALGRAGFGLLLVLAFSLGLAATLTGVGLLFLYASRFLERRATPARWTRPVLRLAPVGGALVVTVAGLAIVVRALGETRLL